VSVNGEELQEGSKMYQSSYSTDGWTGDVKCFKIDEHTGQVLNEESDIVWQARQKLEVETDWDTRKIYTMNAGGSGVVFANISSLSNNQKAYLYYGVSYDSLDAGQKTALAGATATNDIQNRINYIRGDKSLEDGVSFRNRFRESDADDNDKGSHLSDIVHSSPLFFEDMIYVGANDGMLHVFDAETGKEVFSYIPDKVYNNLRYYSLPTYSHKFFVDLTPYAVDTGASLGMILVGGLGKGGKGYYCLDISDPDNFDVSDVKWEYPAPGVTDLDMGYTYSMAYVVKSNDPSYEWIVIFGNGYGSPTGEAVFYVVNPANGALIKKIKTGVANCNGLSTPVGADVNNDYTVDYVYAGDLKGNLWKFDLTGSVSNWSVAYSDGTNPKPLFTTSDTSGYPQPITTKPDVMMHCDDTVHGYIVLFGTGKLLGGTDSADASVQTIYGIWDYGDDNDGSEYLGTFDRNGGNGITSMLTNQPTNVTLLQQTEIYYEEVASCGAHIRVLSDNNPDWSLVADRNATGTNGDVDANAGWYFDLPLTKEKVIRDVIIRDGKAIVITTIPSDSPCVAGGESLLMEMNACSGGRMNDAVLDINDDHIIDEDDMIEIPDPEDSTVIILVAPTGIHYNTMIYPPSILKSDEVEDKYFSTAAGGIEIATETTQETGMLFWRHID
jgi:type IV pilus assembly protein PilY1